MYSKLIVEMRKKKIAQNQLARMIGISDTSFSRKMNGKTVFTLPEAQAIASCLQCSVDHLFQKEN